MRSFRAKLLVALLALAAVPPIWAALRTDGFADRVKRLDREVRAVSQENRKLAEGNRRLSEQASALKQPGPYLETVVRRDLGMLHEGEVVVRPAPARAPRP